MTTMQPNWKRWKTDAAFRVRMEKRAVIIAAIRDFFRSRGFLEAETPTVVPTPGMEPNLDPFRTSLVRHDGATFEAGLITSPEYAMKKLLAAGIPKVFEIARAYRNREPWGGSHNPEFSMLEWYRADAEYGAIMADLEQMTAEVAEKVTGSTSVHYQGRDIDFAPPWPRMTVAEAMERHAGIDLAAGIDDPERFRAAVEAKGCPTSPSDSFDDVFFRIFLRDVEPVIAAGPRPVILHEYPRSMAALARLKADDGRFAERFEAYAGGLELANAYSELNDPVEQRSRLVAEQAERRAAGKHVFPIDEAFIEAVGAMSPSAGIALGVDRLILLLTDAPTLRDVLFFPAGDLFKKENL